MMIKELKSHIKRKQIRSGRRVASIGKQRVTVQLLRGRAGKIYYMLNLTRNTKDNKERFYQYKNGKHYRKSVLCAKREVHGGGEKKKKRGKCTQCLLYLSVYQEEQSSGIPGAWDQKKCPEQRLLYISAGYGALKLDTVQPMESNRLHTKALRELLFVCAAPLLDIFERS